VGHHDLRCVRREAGIALSTGFPTLSVWGVAVEGNRLYASDMLSGLMSSTSPP
jgi:hypothetical protein